MKLEALIAVRYLFTRGQKSVVHVISWISLIGLLVSTAALIIVLSVYNGIGELTKTLFNTFDPELVIEPSEGKTFHMADIDLTNVDGIEYTSQIVSESAWITYDDRQSIVTLRGVDKNYCVISGLDTFLRDGVYSLNIGDDGYGLIVGGEIYYHLDMRLHSNIPAVIHIPKRGTTSIGFSMDEAFNIGYAYPMAYFYIQQDIDRRYVVCDNSLVRRLMGYSPDECTAIALKLKPGVSVQKTKKTLNTQFSTLNSQLTVKDRYDQQPLYFKIFRSERLGIYLILSLIVLISTLSLVSSLSLLIINKRNDIFTLRSMGMTEPQLRRAFFAEGLLICLVAVIAGLAIGFIVCWLQQQFGIIRMGDGNFVVNAFPVDMRGTDFLITFLLVMAISSLSVGLTISRQRVSKVESYRCNS